MCSGTSGQDPIGLDTCAASVHPATSRLRQLVQRHRVCTSNRGALQLPAGHWQGQGISCRGRHAVDLLASGLRGAVPSTHD